MINNIYIDNNLLFRMHELRAKAEEYLSKNPEEKRNTWCGKYKSLGSQVLLVNGLSRDEIKELRSIGLMPNKEYFIMEVKK